MINTLLGLLLVALCVLFATEMRHSMKRSEAAADLIRRYIDDLDNPQLIDEIYDYCQKDFKLKRIIERLAVRREDIAEQYNKLRIWGDIKKGRRYVPITSFFYVYSLEWLLTHKDADPKDAAMKMMNFLHI